MLIGLGEADAYVFATVQPLWQYQPHIAIPAGINYRGFASQPWVSRRVMPRHYPGDRTFG